MGQASQGPRLYVADFSAGVVDVYDGTFQRVITAGNFADPRLPSGYAPFNVMVSGDRVYVSYAKQDGARHDEVAGAGRGRLDVFTLDGVLVRRLAGHGVLNAPWGMTIAPAGFGAFSGDLLVGNFGDGRIHAFDPTTLPFAGTVRENIAYGRLDAGEAEIVEAARRARLDDVIAALPDGLDTVIGERGVKLSGGQKQRLAIARVFLKNPPILILDEATSALDTETERALQQSFTELSAGRTTLVIAHRLATIASADRIMKTPAGGGIRRAEAAPGSKMTRSRMSLATTRPSSPTAIASGDETSVNGSPMALPLDISQRMS